MVMDVVDSYGDWRHPKQAPAPASTREQSPVSGADVNFNSPGHRSSQDGSFIQDEDMQLILEFGAKTSSPNKTAAGVGGGGQQTNIGVLSESWMHRHSKWATDFDANVAELDFDHFSRQDIRTLRRKAAAAFQLGKPAMDETTDMVWDSFTTAAHDASPPSSIPTSTADCNHNKIRTIPPCNSLDASLAISAASLFSSAGEQLDLSPSTTEQQVAILLNQDPAAMPTFISTDSLDMSSMACREELIRAACTTKKQDYVLTFDKGGIAESGVGGSDDTDYQDARLSNALERSLLDHEYGSRENRISESLISGNAEDNGDYESDNSSFGTWHKGKRSYEINRTEISYDPYNAKFTSLPNFYSKNGRESSSTDEYLSGGGERMLSADGEADCVPIYDLKQSTGGRDSSMMESACDESNFSATAEPFSLLKAFKSKLSGTFDRLPLPHFRHVDNSSGDSSGYMTGTGSQQGYTTTGNGTKTKSIQKINNSDEPGNDRPESEDRIQTRMTDDYNYAEFFINGRYIDINHNEIGFVPPSTRGIQNASASQHQEQQSPRSQPQFYTDEKPMVDEFASSPRPQLTSFHKQAADKVKYGQHGRPPPAKPPRTFATLLRQQREAAEEEYETENGNDGKYVLQQRPERAPYGRRILPKIPDESQLNATEISRMRDSATQVPVYVVDQSVQTTSIPNSQHSLIVVTTCVTKVDAGQPFYVGSSMHAGVSTTPASSSKLQDLRKLFFGDGPSTLVNVPELNFLKFPFNVPQLFPHVPPFPLAFINDTPDITSFIAQQAKLCNASDDQLAPPKRLLPTPPLPSLFGLSKLQQNLNIGTQLSLPAAPLLAPQTKSADCGQPSIGPGRRDSGLGSSSGPSHIQDWDSLATLLPKDVLQAYSFFKTNSNLLNKSAPIFRQDLNIDKKHSLLSRTCCNCGSGGGGGGVGRPVQRRSLSKYQQKRNRLGKKQRPLSEPSFKRKQFESIVEEEDKICDGENRLTRDSHECGCHRNNHQHFHHHHLTTWCCTRSTASRNPPNRPSRKHVRNSNLTAKSGGHVCVGDTDDTEEEIENSEKYHPLNNVAKRIGGISSDDERLMKKRHTIYSDDDEEEQDDEDEEFYRRQPPTWNGTHSEYQIRDTITNSCVPKFYSVHNVKEFSQFDDQIGYPLKKLRPTRLTERGSSSATSCNGGDNVRPCATCYRVRSPSQDLTESGSLVVVVEEQSMTDGSEDVDFCDCKTSDIIEELETRKGWSKGQRRIEVCKNCESSDTKLKKKRAAKLYQQKKVLIQNVVAACDLLKNELIDFQRSGPWEELSQESAKAASAIIRYSLCPTVERLVADGLVEGKTVWTVTMASATLGPATKSIHELVTDLEKSVGENGEHSLLFAAFVCGLLNLHSLDCWLSYLALKDRILADSYNERAFMRKAATSYRNLFDELLNSIQPLSMLPFDQLQLDPLSLPSIPVQIHVSSASRDDDDLSSDENLSVDGAAMNSTVSLHKEIVVTFQRPNGENQEVSYSLPIKRNEDSLDRDMRYSLIPTRLPSDSRVPKSSSVPSKMVRHASEPPKSKSVDTGLKSGVVVDVEIMRAASAIPKFSPKRAPIVVSPINASRPSRIPVLKSSRSCPDGPRQRSLSNRRMYGNPTPVIARMESLDDSSESAMSVTASTFSEVDAPDVNISMDSDYRSGGDARYVYAIDEQESDRKKGLLGFSKGDTMVYLDDDKDGFLRCQRNGEVGLVPRKKVTYVTFL